MANYTLNKRGVTFTEITILIVVAAIIGATLAGVVIFFVQLFMYSPRQLNVQKIAQEISNIMIEGNQDIRGIRYAVGIIDASNTQFSYVYGYPTTDDRLSVRFRWEASDKHIYRSTSTDGGVLWSSEMEIPNYITPAIAIDGKDTPSVIFTYKKDNDADWVLGADPLTDIRRIIISIKVKTGSGSFDDFHGTFDYTASVEIKNFSG